MRRALLLALCGLLLPGLADSAEAQAAPPPTADPPLTFERPEHVRGVYVNAWAAGSEKRVVRLLELAERTEINAFVIDIKDATGYVSHATRVPLALEVGADQERRIPDLEGLLRRLHQAGIYPIARIVVTKDPMLTEARPDLAIQDSAGGVWSDQKNMVWANPYQPEVWEYHVALAREAAEAGFPEIQWDYVRFPDAPKERLQTARYPGSDGRIRARAIREFLTHTRQELSELEVVVTADVFGVTTSFHNDVGIGQLWEQFIDVVDVALPMVYPSHYWEGSFGYSDPNGHPYEIVYHALKSARERSEKVAGAGTIRPWLQDFSMGEPAYGPAEVRAQIQATYDVGIQEWILWNPGSRYTADALAPENGFPEGWDPYIRVARTLVPASQAEEAMRRTKEARAARSAADSIPAPAPADTAGSGSRESPGSDPLPDRVPEQLPR